MAQVSYGEDLHRDGSELVLYKLGGLLGQVLEGFKGRDRRARGFRRLLARLSASDVPGKEQAERYLRLLYRRNLRPNTLASSLTAILLFLWFIKQAGRSRLDEITKADLEGFVEHEQDRGLRASSVRTRLMALYGFLRFMSREGVIQADVTARKLRIKLPETLPRAMDPADVGQLLSVIDHTRDRAMILLLLRTGMRIGELLNIQPRDIHLTERKILIYEAEKNRMGRAVYMSDDAVEALLSWLRRRDEKKPLLFYGQGHDSMSYSGARMRFNKYIHQAALSHKGYSLHSLRHSFATELLNAGMRLECLQQLLGHSSLELTRRYARLSDKTREAEYFRAMAKIQKGEADGDEPCDHQLQTPSEEKELLGTHGQKPSEPDQTFCDLAQGPDRAGGS